jgi:hypothetical protein
MELLEYIVALWQRGLQYQQSVKIRPSIFLFIVIAVVLIALMLRHGLKKPMETPPTASVETNIVPQVVTAPSSSVNSHVRTNSSLRQVATHTATLSKQDKGEQIKEGLAVLNDVPIVFYGRLEDQLGNAVSGAQIVANVRIYNDVQSTVEHLTVMSDGNGFFQIKGGKGESLGIVPKKEGYVLATTSTEFKYSYMYDGHFTSDQNNPTVIKMWKLQGAEPLASLDKTYKLHYTSAPIYFDMIAGKIVSGSGDLKITVNRPDGIISQQHPQNWNIQIEVVDGGLIETSFEESSTTYSAPESGYQTSGTFGNNNGPDLVDKIFFIQSRNGQVYSKVHLLFGINDTSDEFMPITFTGVANTNSSRNWEATAPR